MRTKATRVACNTKTLYIRTQATAFSRDVTYLIPTHSLCVGRARSPKWIAGARGITSSPPSPHIYIYKNNSPPHAMSIRGISGWNRERERVPLTRPAQTDHGQAGKGQRGFSATWCVEEDARTFRVSLSQKARAPRSSPDRGTPRTTHRQV